MADHEIQRLQALHTTLMDRVLTGASQASIARELGMPENSVYRITRSPVFQGELARRRRDVEQATVSSIALAQGRMREKLAKSGEKAVDTLDGLMDSESENTKRLSAVEVLKAAFTLDGSGAAATPGVVVNQVTLVTLQKALAASRDDAALPAPADIIDTEVMPSAK